MHGRKVFRLANAAHQLIQFVISQRKTAIGKPLAQTSCGRNAQARLRQAAEQAVLASPESVGQRVALREQLAELTKFDFVRRFRQLVNGSQQRVVSGLSDLFGQLAELRVSSRAKFSVSAHSRKHRCGSSTVLPSVAVRAARAAGKMCQHCNCPFSKSRRQRSSKRSQCSRNVWLRKRDESFA